MVGSSFDLLEIIPENNLDYFLIVVRNLDFFLNPNISIVWAIFLKILAYMNICQSISIEHMFSSVFTNSKSRHVSEVTLSIEVAHHISRKNGK